MDSQRRHAAKLDRIATQLRRHRGDRPLSLRKRAVSHVVPKRHDLRRADDKIDISDLDQILSIDLDAMTCTAEPGVTFRDLVDGFETELILQALERTQWNKNQAARLLGLNRTTLLEKMKKKGLEQPERTAH